MATRAPVLPWTPSIRALACISVLVWHGLLTVIPHDATPAQMLVILPLGTIAREAVLVFILMSAYLLGRHWTHGLADSDVGRTFRIYIVRRSWRLVPAFWVAVTLSVLAMLLLGLRHAQGTHWDAGLPLTAWRVLANYLLVTDFVNVVPVSHQLWTVPVEYHLYFLAPLIILSRRRGRVVVLSALGCLAIVFLTPWFTAPYFLFAFMTAFWLGAHRQALSATTLAATLRLNAPIMLASLALFVLALGFGSLPESTAKYFAVDALIGPVFLAWMYHRDVAGRRTWSVRVLEWKPLIWLGDRSYSLYLVHGLVIEVMWRFVIRPLDLPGDTVNVLAVVTIGSLTSLAATVVFFRTVEVPSMRRASAYGKRTAPAPARPAATSPLIQEPS